MITPTTQIISLKIAGGPQNAQRLRLIFRRSSVPDRGGERLTNRSQTSHAGVDGVESLSFSLWWLSFQEMHVKLFFGLKRPSKAP